MEAQFSEAKRWWLCENLLRVLVALWITASLFFKDLSETTWVIPAVATATYVFIQWRADVLQGRAEAIIRKLELREGFGREISEQDKADLFMEASRRSQKKALEPEESPYFDSPKLPSSLGAVENVRQSAWFTKHLAGSIAAMAFFATVLVFSIFFVSLVIVVQSPSLQLWGSIIGRATVTLLVFLSAMGYLRLGFRYRSYSQRSERIVERASGLNEQERASDIEALLLLHEFQICRAAAPMIPEWLWKRRKDELNRLWDQRSK